MTDRFIPKSYFGGKLLINWKSEPAHLNLVEEEVTWLLRLEQQQGCPLVVPSRRRTWLPAPDPTPETLAMEGGPRVGFGCVEGGIKPGGRASGCKGASGCALRWWDLLDVT